jgi:hypothetical protein
MNTSTKNRVHRALGIATVGVCSLALLGEWYGAAALSRENSALSSLGFFFSTGGMWVFVRNVVIRKWADPEFRLRMGARTVAWLVGSVYASAALVWPPVAGARQGATLAIIVMSTLFVIQAQTRDLADF